MATKTSTKPRTYQVPKANHPWRQYPNKKKKAKSKDRDDVIHIKEFLVEITDNWETYEIYIRKDIGGGGFRKVKTLPQKKIATWLASMVKKTYVDEL